MVARILANAIARETTAVAGAPSLRELLISCVGTPQPKPWAPPAKEDAGVSNAAANALEHARILVASASATAMALRTPARDDSRVAFAWGALAGSMAVALAVFFALMIL